MSQSSKCNYTFGKVTANAFVPANKDAVVQTTSISTAVSVSYPVGKITTYTSSSLIATNGSASFTVAAPFVNSNSIILTSISKVVGNGNPHVKVTSYSAGSFTMTIDNASDTAPMNGGVEIAYNIL